MKIQKKGGKKDVKKVERNERDNKRVHRIG